MWPMPRAPISTTTAWVPSGALSSVSGTPSSLLNDWALAAVTRRSLRMLARRSFTDVLPTEPVIPNTGLGSRVRAKRPAACSARTVSSTTIAVPPVDPAGGEVGGRAGRRAPRR